MVTSPSHEWGIAEKRRVKRTSEGWADGSRQSSEQDAKLVEITNLFNQIESMKIQSLNRGLDSTAETNVKVLRQTALCLHIFGVQKHYNKQMKTNHS